MKEILDKITEAVEELKSVCEQASTPGIKASHAIDWCSVNYDEGYYFTGRVMTIDSLRRCSDYSPDMVVLSMTEEGSVFRYSARVVNTSVVVAVLKERPGFKVENMAEGYSVGRFEYVMDSQTGSVFHAHDSSSVVLCADHCFGPDFGGYRYRAHKEPELNISGFEYSGEFRRLREGEAGTPDGMDVYDKGVAPMFILKPKPKAYGGEDVRVVVRNEITGGMIFLLGDSNVTMNAADAEWCSKFKCYRTPDGDFDRSHLVPDLDGLLEPGCGVVLGA